ncbi:class I SAM-dependent methyltransferase [Aureimonas mangrovi]|uniref:class I SAM-dependent methyltransferase n=1 Tax=Aureimonas mangrovi TaxID=2758041 RepID=UPI00163D6BCA|nr:class I SAM-dependent methyltransferase [Aureimonas mangrovi]
MSSPFEHYNAAFDPIALIQKYEKQDRVAAGGLLTNFLGVRIDPAAFGGLLAGHEGSVEPLPIPANWHADIAEWGAALRAVDHAKGLFRMVELGCGWGCWLNNAGAAARSRGLEIDLIGIEGDDVHISSAVATLKLNGFSPSEFRIIHGVAAPSSGKALFPRSANPGGSWGSAPIFNASDEQLAEADRLGDYYILESFPLREIVGDLPIDLLHIDIQGGEADFIKSNFDDIKRYVRRVLIGTHSRVIEGDLLEYMIRSGWLLEIERPAIFDISDGVPVIRVDGVQLYANPALVV